ncbi:MAG: PadR family transcriptional regulator [Maribacter sp.]|uniref:PadR family transcriptional regulator n=1 Tax=Maribacter sp. TaxID=1897614 RepID=UPI003C737E70
MKKAFKITSLDYAILGLIHQEPLSGYGIRKQFETTALGNYSSSPGAVYPALNRLQKFNLVTKSRLPEQKKEKFHCTSLGLNTLKEWLLLPVEITDVAKRNDELLLKFAFMHKLLHKNQVLEFLQSFKIQLQLYIAELKEFHKREGAHLPLHGRLAFEHGLASYSATLTWCKSTISTIRNHQKK